METVVRRRIEYENMLLFIIIATDIIIAFVVNLNVYNIIPLPIYLRVLIPLLLLIANAGTYYRIKRINLIGMLGISIFFIWGIFGALPPEDEAHRWAREGIDPPLIATSYFILSKIALVIILTSAWIFASRRLSRNRRRLDNVGSYFE